MGRQCSVDDILINEQLNIRPVHPAHHDLELQVLQRLVRRFSSESSELMNDTVAAVCELSKAESAGITLLEALPDGTEGLRWVATTGRIRELGLQTLPRAYSPCGIVLDRQGPQLFSYPGRWFSYIEDSWDIVELLLVPWKIGEKVRGTLWAVIHDSSSQFDREDLRILQNLVVFASAAVCRNELETARLAQERVAAAARVAHQLAHAMNNPLQALTNSLYLVGGGKPEHLEEAKQQLERLSKIVRTILEINTGPFAATSDEAGGLAILPVWITSAQASLEN